MKEEMGKAFEELKPEEIEQLSQEDLSAVNGAGKPNGVAANCPNCGRFLWSAFNLKERKDGCSTIYYWECTMCGYTWLYDD